jgi:hypothetical protein
MVKIKLNVPSLLEGKVVKKIILFLKSLFSDERIEYTIGVLTAFLWLSAYFFFIPRHASPISPEMAYLIGLAMMVAVPMGIRGSLKLPRKAVLVFGGIWLAAAFSLPLLQSLFHNFILRMGG